MKIRISDLFPSVTSESKPTLPAVDNSTPLPSSVDHPEVSEQKPTEPSLTLKSEIQPVVPKSNPSAPPAHNFLPDMPETEPPKAVPTDRGARIRCLRCNDYTPHAEQACDYPEYAADWLLYVCKPCGGKTYARKDA